MNKRLKSGPSGNGLSRTLSELFSRDYSEGEIIQQLVGQSYQIGQQAVGYLHRRPNLLDLLFLGINDRLKGICATACCPNSTAYRGLYEKT